MFFDQVKTDEAFNTILRRIEQTHESNVKRVVRTAQNGNVFYCTIILENFELLEVTITAGRLGHMGALECEIEVF